MNRTPWSSRSLLNHLLAPTGWRPAQLGALAAVLSMGCTEVSFDATAIDDDDDGVTAAEDCNDRNAAIHPNADEICDGVDNDCDDKTDADDDDLTDATIAYVDADGDLAGDSATARPTCDALLDGEVDVAGDCDDASADIGPLAAERCNDIDDDCDGLTDEADPDLRAVTYYKDLDGDRYGDPDTSVLACDEPDGYVGNQRDCDDDDPDRSPETLWYVDSDGDGHGDPATEAAHCVAEADEVATADDCDDSASAISPSADEACNGYDDDCDGLVDDADGDATPVNATTWYLDRDADGHGLASSSQASCTAPAAHIAGPADDCDDAASSVHPGAAEVCDEIDNDCDDDVDSDDVDFNGELAVWYVDDDGDDYGVEAGNIATCTDPGEGWATRSGDCNDGNANLNPETTWFFDGDSDGFGSTATQRCEAEPGEVSVGGDCDDSSGEVYPGAAGRCMGIDDDCSGLVVREEANLGESSACAVESCFALMQGREDLAGSTDGPFSWWLDPGTGPRRYACNFAPAYEGDTGGWTRIVRWRLNDIGGGVDEAVAQFEEEFDVFETSDLTWGFETTTQDELGLRPIPVVGTNDTEFVAWGHASVDVPIPNEGHVWLALVAEGDSMDQSGLYFWATADDGSTVQEADLSCRESAMARQDIWPPEVLERLPAYTCPENLDADGNSSDNFRWNTSSFRTLDSSVTTFDWTNVLTVDSAANDVTLLEAVVLWVR